MATNPVTYRGESAAIKIGEAGSEKTHTTIGLSDITLNLDRGTVEQELVGESGNYRAAGSLSVEGSLTACKLDNTAAGVLLAAVISGTYIVVSGSVGSDSLHFFFLSGMVTGFDLTIGDADTITEGSMDWTLADPQNVTTVQYGDSDGKIWISDTSV